MGLVRTVGIDSLRETAGKFEMNKDFALYSNMDFFLFLSATNPPRLELQAIDPTRKGDLLNPQLATIPVNAKV